MPNISAIHVANYVIDLTPIHITPNHQHLQHLLYYLNVNYIHDYKQPLFLDEMMLNKLGPYTPSVKESFSDFGANIIDRPKTMIGNTGDPEAPLGLYTPYITDDKTQTIVDIYLDQLRHVDRFNMIDLLQQHAPIQQYSTLVETGVKSIRLDMAELRQYYRANPDELIVRR